MTESTIETSTFKVSGSEKTPIRILHVDDDAGFVEVAKQCLEMQGNIEVETANSVEEAFEMLKEKAYDVIVSDYQMPGKGGLEFLRELREAGNQIPFVMFTGKGREEVAVKALNLGADQYISKFGDPDAVYSELAHAVDHAVEVGKAREALHRSEAKYRSLVEDAGAGILTADAKGTLTFVNKELCNILGVSQQELLGKQFSDFVHPDDRQRIVQISVDFMKNPNSRPRFEFRAIHKKGHIVHLHSAPTLIKYDNEIIGSHVIITDITARKKAEEALKESEVKFRSIFESANDCFFYLDKSGRIIDINQKAVQLFGRSKEELFGKHFAKLGAISPKDLPMIMKAFAQSLTSKKHNLNVCIKDTRGQCIPLECSSSFIKASDKVTGVLVAARDVTERKKTEEALMESEDKFRSLVEGASVAIAVSDMGGRFSYVNKALDDLLGYSQEELIGQPFKNFIHPADRGRIVRLFLRSIVLPLGPRRIELRVLRKDGSIAYITSTPTRFSVRGKTIGFLAIMTEITEQKKSLEMMKTLNEKMEVVGSLTRHDLRNKLSNILGRVWLAKKKLAENHEASIDLDEVESSISQAERILDFAGTYEKLGIEKLTYIHVSTSIRQAISILPKAQSEPQGVKVADETQGLMVLADSLLRQLFYNLIHNSIEHGERVQHITIRHVRVGGDLKLIYEDDGVGIPKGEKKKIFKEGYGKGSGYGLFLIRKMCEVFGWAISETGKEGKGAQFTITIPEGRFELPQ
jgi:PAS domain S-box-containing protein